MIEHPLMWKTAWWRWPVHDYLLWQGQEQPINYFNPKAALKEIMELGTLREDLIVEMFGEVYYESQIYGTLN